MILFHGVTKYKAATKMF